MNKVSDAQKKASRAWEKRNPERTKMLRYRRSARYFIHEYAQEEDLQELERLIEERREKNKNISSKSIDEI
ncbi:MAG: hypothetical protein Q4A78_12395 [Peptostreptococcaceae bacterium]|nr:hypothetical protein [Peptostreptococcaceae bacterium]